MNLTLPIVSAAPAALGTCRGKHCLDDAFDARLFADPRVRDFRRSQFRDSILATSAAPSGSTVRTVRLTDRILVVVAIPDGAENLTLLRRGLSEHYRRRELLVIPEGYLRRQPHLDGSLLIADSSGYRVSPLARLLLAEHLTENGGSSHLRDCAAHMPRARDPVQAVLALAAAKAVVVDISRPIGPMTRVSLPPAH